MLSNTEATIFAGRKYYSGEINGIKTVVVISGWGKVAAAATVATLIHKFNISELIFTGVAGALHTGLHVGDVVIGKRLIQHDMDARPFFPQYEIPLLKKTFFDVAPQQLTKATTAVQNLLEFNSLHSLIGNEELLAFNIVSPKLYVGDIASGDQFIAGTAIKQQLLQNLPGILCVEMEGAAVAQVCFENEIPCTIIRTISDVANEESPVDFMMFVQKIAGNYSSVIIKNIFDQLH